MLILKIVKGSNNSCTVKSIVCYIAWKVSKCGVFSGPYFPVFGLNTEIYGVEELWQLRKKKKSCPWLLNNCASDCWTIVPATVELSCQRLLNYRASDCWTIVPVTVKQSCQRLLNNLSSDYCWTFVPVTFEELCQWLLKNRASDCSKIMPVSIEELYQRLLKNYAIDC